MQDSFNARMQGQSPASITKQKTGKGWMILSVILFILLIGGGVFAGMIIVKGNRDTNKLSEVENELQEKDAKIAELESNNKQIQAGDTIRIADTGIYLRYPTTIKNMSYTINYGFTSSDIKNKPAISIDFTGYKSDMELQNILDFANINNWSLASLNIYSKSDDYKSCDELKADKNVSSADSADCNHVYVDDYYYIQLNTPQNLIYDDEHMQKIELETTNVFIEWLSDPDTYITKR